MISPSRPSARRSTHRRCHTALALVALLAGSGLACGKKAEQKPAAERPAKAQEQRPRQSIAETMQALLTTPNAERREKLVERIAALAAADRTDLGAPGVSAVGITADFWTVEGKPAGVLVRNDSDQAIVPTLRLGCYAPGGEAPKVLIDDGEGKIEFVFDPNGERDQELSAVPAKSSRLFIVATDRSWKAGPPDGRELGVQVLPKVRINGG